MQIWCKSIFSSSESAPAKPSLREPTAIKVNEEYIDDPAKIADAFNEYFTALTITSDPPDDLITKQSELIIPAKLHH